MSGTVDISGMTQEADCRNIKGSPKIDLKQCTLDLSTGLRLLSQPGRLVLTQVIVVIVSTNTIWRGQNNSSPTKFKRRRLERGGLRPAPSVDRSCSSCCLKPSLAHSALEHGDYGSRFSSGSSPSLISSSSKAFHMLMTAR